jgi:hypothetical protein
MTLPWRIPRTIGALAVCVAAGCASTRSVTWDHPFVSRPLRSPATVFVMPPEIDRVGAPGNIGRDLPAIQSQIASRILSIVGERFAGARLTGGQPSPSALQQLRSALTEGSLSVPEYRAAADAYSRGATHLLVSSIEEWKENRTDDPVGALLVPRNAVAVRLRLIQLQPTTTIAAVTFRHRARLTLNRPAMRLLDGRFRQVVLQLVERLAGAGSA